MKAVYLIPFTYFFDTRLRAGSVAFHAVFEWLAAVVMVCLLGMMEPVQSLLVALLAYLAFISLYEIGYIFNDLFASTKENGGRKRGPQGAGQGWVTAWFTVRLVVFVAATHFAGQMFKPAWWSFFGALCLVFALHNVLVDREFKAATFLWLAWFRFMAPIMFAVQQDQRMGIAFAAAMGYSAFRLFGYLDSKGLLKMPGRQRPAFRLFFFTMPLAGALAIWPDPSGRGFVFLASYFALAASLGTLAARLVSGARRIKQGT